LDETYVVTATVPDSFTVTGSDKGDFSDCETEGQVVTCTIDTALDESQSVSFTISVTPTQVGTFPATGTFTYEEIVPEVKTPAKGRVADLSRAPAATTTGTVTHNIQVVGPAASPTPTVSSAPTKTAAPTHTPTHKATHKPTHKATVRATATTKAQTQVLPNTGGSDLGELAAAGSALVVVGAWVTIATRRRRPASGRHR
jgi:LPXTG-motif cell wall-anchored protein